MVTQTQFKQLTKKYAEDYKCRVEFTRYSRKSKSVVLCTIQADVPGQGACTTAIRHLLLELKKLKLKEVTVYASPLGDEYILDSLEKERIVRRLANWYVREFGFEMTEVCLNKVSEYITCIELKKVL